MTTFTITLDLTSLYTTDIPALEILIDGVVQSNFLVTDSYIPTDYNFSSARTIPDISFRFSDTFAELNRTIVINNIEINGVGVDSSSLSQQSLNNNEFSTINTVAEQNSFNATPQIEDFSGATIIGTANDNINLRSTSDVNDIDVIDAQAGNDVARGRDQDDIFFMREGNDRVFAFGGDDIAVGGSGDDFLNMGEGNDQAWGGDGNDTVDGDDGNDILHGGSGNDTVRGKNGNDILNGGFGDDRIQGGNGNDISYGDAGNDKILDSFGDDIAYGGEGNDIIKGRSGNDTLYGDEGNDSLYGDGQDDTLDGGLGNDYLDGGDGIDDALYSGEYKNYLITTNESSNVYYIFDSLTGYSDTAVRVENFIFGNVAKITEEVVNEQPIITSNAGLKNVALDIFENSTNSMMITATDAETNASNLTYNISGGLDAASFTIDSGTGALSFVSTPNYESTSSNGDTIFDVEVQATDEDGLFDSQSISINLLDVNENDIGNIILTSGEITLGNDIIYHIETGGDRDWFSIDLAANQTYVISARGASTEGGSNIDPHIYNIHDSFGAILPLLGPDDSGIDNNDSIGNDSLIYFTPTTSETHYIDAGSLNNETGDVYLSIDLAGINVSGSGNINGTANADYLEGNVSADILFGASGDDILYGLDGNDILEGGEGVDVLYGGSGADTFVLSSTDNSDAIIDFDAVEGDILDFSNIFENFSLQDDINDFLQFTEVGNDTVVKVDTNGKIGFSNFNEVAVLEGNLGENIQTLYSNGQIIG